MDWSTRLVGRTIVTMKKRILVALLWFYAGWYGAAHLAAFLALDPMIGPIVGAVATVLVTVDPFGLFWERQPKMQGSPEAAPDLG